jgi:5'-3' exonuclease
MTKTIDPETARQIAQAERNRRPQPPRMTARTFYIIDGHAMIHRAYHSPTANLECECPECDGRGHDRQRRVIGASSEGQPPCPNCDGTGREPTKATYVFTRALLKLCRELKPTYLCFTTDSPRATLHRTKLYPAYKANRPPSEWQLSTQIRRIKQIVKALGIPILHAPGYEADDVIATLVDASQNLYNLETLIVSRDKDLAQLIGAGVRMYDLIADEFLDGRWVERKWGIHPSQVVDFFSMVGDGGDNIKGVPGIGEKGAAELLRKHHTIKFFLERCKPQTRPEQLLADNVKAYHDAKQLITLERDCPVEGLEDWADLEFRGLKMRKAAPIFRSLGFQRLAGE